MPAFQTPQKPVRTYGIRALVPPGGQEPEALYVSADAVLLVRVESSKSFLGKSGTDAHAVDSVRTEHLVKVLEVLKRGPAVQQNTDLLVEQFAGEVDAGEYLLKSREPALSKGEWILFLRQDRATKVLRVQDAAHAFRIKNGKIDTDGATTREGADAGTLLAQLRQLKRK